MTQIAAAIGAKISLSVYQRIENRGLPEPSLAKKIKVAQYLGIQFEAATGKVLSKHALIPRAPGDSDPKPPAAPAAIRPEVQQKLDAVMKAMGANPKASQTILDSLKRGDDRAAFDQFLGAA